MAMYAISIIPLIQSLKTDTVTQVGYSDDASAGGSLLKLRQWWDKLTYFGYFPNASKSWLVVKEGFLPEVSDIFSGTSLNITDSGRRFLGAAIESFVMEVSSWVHIIFELSTYANSQPHAAYSAVTKGLFSKWNFLTRTIPSISHLLQPLEEVISQKFIPSVTGRCALNCDERDLLSLPTRMGGLGICNPSHSSDSHYELSMRVSAPLVDLIMGKSSKSFFEAWALQMSTKLEIRSEIHKTVILDAAQRICKIV